MAWLATHAVGSTLVWYVPVVLSALAFVRAIGLYKKLQLAGQYLRATEQAFLAVKRPNGWEHYLKSRGGFWVSGSSALYG
jgi:hypothetical protein